MYKLIHIVRGTPDTGISFSITSVDNGEGLRLRRHPLALLPRALDVEHSNFMTEAEFILVDEVDVPQVVTAMTAANPGREVRVYVLEEVAQCPAGKMVTKKVTAHGVLPS